MRFLTRQHGEKWDSILPQAEFAYNDTINRSTGKSPFQIMYGLHPRGVLELRKLSHTYPISADGERFAEAIKEVHEQVKIKLQKSSEKYEEHADQKRREVQFQVGEFGLGKFEEGKVTQGQIH